LENQKGKCRNFMTLREMIVWRKGERRVSGYLLNGEMGTLIRKQS